MLFPIHGEVPGGAGGWGSPEFDSPARPGHGEGGGPSQKARVHLPIERDLRWPVGLLRLRPVRRRAEASDPRPVVAPHGGAARRRGRPGVDAAHARGGLGGVRPPDELRGPAAAVPGRVQEAVARRPCDGGEVPGVRRAAGRRAAVQPDVQDLRRPPRGPRFGGVFAPGDRAGHVRRLQERDQLDPRAGTVRDRAAGQGVSERDHARELRVPGARVRADGDGVLRAAAPGRRGVRLLAQAAPALVHGHPRHPARPSAHVRPPEGIAVALLEADDGHRI